MVFPFSQHLASPLAASCRKDIERRMRDVVPAPVGDLRTTQLQPAAHPTSEETRARLEQDHHLVGYLIARFGNWLFEPLFYYGATVVTSGACIEFYATLKDKETVHIEINGGAERYCIQQVDRRLRLVPDSKLLHLSADGSCPSNPRPGDSEVSGFEYLNMPVNMPSLTEEQIMPSMAVRSIRWFFDQYWQQKAIA